MRVTTFQEKLTDVQRPVPPFESFCRVGDLTALRQDSNGDYYRSNYQRGPLLYSLVASSRPRVVLEFGTGRGYGALCMARALVDNAIDGRIFTIDAISYGEKQLWWLDSGDGPRTAELSLKQVWETQIDPQWVERITCLTGTSVSVMETWKKLALPAVDFAFVDGGHRYEAVRHDFFSVLDVAAPQFQALFDDYADRPGYGVQRLIDEELEPVFETELILSDDGAGNARRQHTSPVGRMVLIDSRNVKVPWRQVFTPELVQSTLSGYRREERWRRVRGTARTALRPLMRLVKAR